MILPLEIVVEPDADITTALSGNTVRVNVEPGPSGAGEVFALALDFPTAHRLHEQLARVLRTTTIVDSHVDDLLPTH